LTPTVDFSTVQRYRTAIADGLAIVIRACGAIASGRAPHLAAGLAVLAAYSYGALDFLEYRFMDARFRQSDRTASGNVVVVAIDPQSIDQAGVWPWPRDLHALLIRRLLDSGVRQIGYAIDFSSPSTPAQDRQLTDVLVTAGNTVVLATFRQFAGPGDSPIVETRPLPEFRRHSRLASINFDQSPDGLVRRTTTTEPWSNGPMPTLAAALSGAQPGVPYYIDYGIAPDSIPRYSFTDVLDRRVAPEALRGRTVLVGATAAELGNRIAVPNHGNLPGVMVEALATESVLQKRMLRRTPFWIPGAIAVFIAVTLGPMFGRWPWYLSVIGATTVALGAVTAGRMLYAGSPILFDAAPILAALALSFTLGILGRANRLASDLLAQRSVSTYRQALTASIVHQSFDGIFTVDGTGRIRSFNTAATRIFDRSADTLIGHNASVLFPDMRDGFVGDVMNVLITRTSSSRSGEPVETTGRRANGTLFPMELSIVRPRVDTESIRFLPDRAAGDVFVCTVRDITERRAAQDRVRRLNEELEDRVVERTRELQAAQAELVRIERLATLGQLTATVSHELRNPLGTIRNSARTLGLMNGTPTMRRTVDRIEANIVRCDRIISELLDYSRERELLLQTVDLPSFLEGVISEVPVVRDHKVAVHFAIEEMTVRIDPERLERAVRNLIDNAVQSAEDPDRAGAWPEGFVLTVEGTTGGRTAIIRVSDNGPGIPGDVIPRVFEPFFSTRGFGVGLGLPLVKRIIEQHGGAIAIESTAGIGTRVTLSLPLEGMNTGGPGGIRLGDQSHCNETGH
jgi:PAS domain S-box-containing protein